MMNSAWQEMIVFGRRAGRGGMRLIMRTSYWIAASASTAYIARPNGAVDFLFTSKDDSMANFFKADFLIVRWLSEL